MSKRHRFLGSVIQIIKHNRDGSRATQANRRQQLLQMLNELYTSGFQLEHVRYIKQRHIKCLVNQWLAERKSAGTIKNRVTNLRWLMRKLNKVNTVPDNDSLGIPKRVYVTNKDKSVQLSEGHWQQMHDPRVKLSLKGQKLFGLRLQESLKLQPYIADGGHYLYIKSSWSKGGRERIIAIRTAEQRDWLDRCKSFVRTKQSSLIPDDKLYKQHQSYVIRCCEAAGVNKRHGLRHRYAQQRYREITGWDCPAKGGPKRSQLSPALKIIDRSARLQISFDLGHSRINSITGVYLG